MRKHLFYLINFFLLTAAVCLLYYFLLQNTMLHLSISEILDFAHKCTKYAHLFIIGFIPIYLGLIIFGTALFFNYLYSFLWPILSHYLWQWFHIGQKS